VGPWLVTADEFDNPDDLGLGCSINSEPVQAGHTRELIFSGTPQGVGMGRTPPRWFAPGDVLTSYILGIGEMRHRFVASGPRGLDASSDPEEER
jgi:2,4-didehydro-3-deoxy-L-rhamnonate hydrolase